MWPRIVLIITGNLLRNERTSEIKQKRTGGRGVGCSSGMERERRGRKKKRGGGGKEGVGGGEIRGEKGAMVEIFIRCHGVLEKKEEKEEKEKRERE